MKKSDILFLLFVIALFLPFFISDTIYEWYKSFNAIHGMVMSFVKFAILVTLGEMLGLRISTGVYHNKTFGIIPRMVIWGVLGMGINMAMIIFQKALPFLGIYGSGICLHIDERGFLSCQISGCTGYFRYNELYIRSCIHDIT